MAIQAEKNCFTHREAKCDDGGENLVAVKLQFVLRTSKAKRVFRTRSAYGVERASTHAYTHLPEAFRCRTDGRTDAVSPFGSEEVFALW